MVRSDFSKFLKQFAYLTTAESDSDLLSKQKLCPGVGVGAA